MIFVLYLKNPQFCNLRQLSFLKILLVILIKDYFSDFLLSSVVDEATTKLALHMKVRMCYKEANSYLSTLKLLGQTFFLFFMNYFPWKKELFYD